MFLSVIAILGTLSLLVDALLWYRLKKRAPERTGLRHTFIVLTFVAYFLILTLLVLYRYWGREHDGTFALGLMWAIWILFLNLHPKLTYVIISSLDYPAGWLRRKRTRWFHWAGLLLGGFALFVILWGSTAGRSWLRVNEVEIASERVPESFDGYRIALVADLHLGNYPRTNTLIRRMVARVNAQRPDMTVVAGDVVNRWVRDLTAEDRADLSRLRATDGVFAVLGNHDLGFYMRDIPEMTPAESVRALIISEKGLGWNILLNESEFVVRGSDTISVSGMKYPMDGFHRGHDTGLGGADPQQTYDGIPDHFFNILIAHTPEQWDQILQETPADLTLAGHVHAMQLKFKLGKGRGWSPAAWFYPRWSGLYEEGGRYLFINDGIGFVMIPMRFGTRPEITMLTLRRQL